MSLYGVPFSRLFIMGQVFAKPKSAENGQASVQAVVFDLTHLMTCFSVSDDFSLLLLPVAS